MKTLIASLVLASSMAHAGQIMGNEALEMARVMSHPAVKECIADVNLNNMINLRIEKKVYRCPGCNTYAISGRELMIDVPAVHPTIITIVGKMELGFGGQMVQTYKCDVK